MVTLIYNKGNVFLSALIVGTKFFRPSHLQTDSDGLDLSEIDLYGDTAQSYRVSSYTTVVVEIH